MKRMRLSDPKSSRLGSRATGSPVARCCGAVLGVLVLSTSGFARAGDDSSCEADAVVDYPQDGDADVPLRPVFVHREGLTRYTENYPLVLQAVGGAQVPVFPMPFTKCGMLRMPGAQLTPETRYQLLLRQGEVVTFTTGSSDAAPAPVLTVGADRDPSTVVEFDFESNVPLVLMIVGIPFSGGVHRIALSPVDSPIRFDAAFGRPGAPISVKVWDRLGQSAEVMMQPDTPAPAERDGGCSAVAGSGRARPAPVLFGLLTLLVLLARRSRALGAT